MRVEIVLPTDGPSYYFGGDLIKAQVIVDCGSSPRITRSLFVDIYGRIDTMVEDTEVGASAHGNSIAMHAHTVKHKSSRKLIGFGRTLLGVSWSSRKTGKVIQLNPGVHTYDVQFRLPVSLPPSMKLSPISAEAQVKYELRVFFDAPGTFAFNKETKLVVPIGGYDQPHLSLRQLYAPQSKFGRCVSKTFLMRPGELQLTGRLPRKAFFKKEKVSVHIVVKNQSTKNVSAIRFSLRRQYTIVGDSKSQSDSRTIPMTTVTRSVPAVGGNLDESITVELPAPHESSCADSLLQIKFHLCIELIMSSFLAANLVLWLPITLLRRRRGGLPCAKAKNAIVASPVVPIVPRPTPTTTTTASDTPSDEGTTTTVASAAVATAAAAPGTAVKKHYKFPSGIVYDGMWLHGKANGYGKMVLTSGSVYEGEFLDGNYNGHGRFTTHDGTIYEGQFARDRYNGVGRLQRKDGSVYEGHFQESMYHGPSGKQTTKDGDVYEGPWVRGFKSGRGRFSSHKDGSVFEGDFDKGLKHGEGMMTYANGDVFKGIWYKNVIVDGTYFYLDTDATFEASEQATEAANALVGAGRDILDAPVDLVALRDILPEELLSSLVIPNGACAATLIADGRGPSALSDGSPSLSAEAEQAAIDTLVRAGAMLVNAYAPNGSPLATVDAMELFSRERGAICDAITSRLARVEALSAEPAQQHAAALDMVRVLADSLGARILINQYANSNTLLQTYARVRELLGPDRESWASFVATEPAFACVLLHTLAGRYARMGLRHRSIEACEESLQICERAAGGAYEQAGAFRHVEETLARQQLLSVRSSDLDRDYVMAELGRMRASATSSNIPFLDRSCDMSEINVIYIVALLARQQVPGTLVTETYEQAMYQPSPVVDECLVRMNELCDQVNPASIDGVLATLRIASIQHSVGQRDTAAFRAAAVSAMREAVRIASVELLTASAVPLCKGHTTPVAVRSSLLMLLSQLMRVSGALSSEATVNMSIQQYLDVTKDAGRHKNEDEDEDDDDDDIEGTSDADNAAGNAASTANATEQHGVRASVVGRVATRAASAGNTTTRQGLMMLALGERLREYYALGAYTNDRRPFVQEFKIGRMHEKLAAAAALEKNTLLQTLHEQCALESMRRAVYRLKTVRVPLAAIHLETFVATLQVLRRLAPKHAQTIRILHDALDFVRNGQTRHSPDFEAIVQGQIGYTHRDRGERTLAIKWLVAALTSAARIMKLVNQPFTEVPDSMIDQGRYAKERTATIISEAAQAQQQQPQPPSPSLKLPQQSTTSRPASLVTKLIAEEGGGGGGEEVVRRNGSFSRDVADEEVDAEETAPSAPILFDEGNEEEDEAETGEGRREDGAQDGDDCVEEAIGVGAEEEEEEEEEGKTQQQQQRLSIMSKVSEDEIETPKVDASRRRAVEEAKPSDFMLKLEQVAKVMSPARVDLLTERSLWYRYVLAQQYAALAKRPGQKESEHSRFAQLALNAYLNALYAGCDVLAIKTVCEGPAGAHPIEDLVQTLKDTVTPKRAKGIHKRLWNFMGTAAFNLSQWMDTPTSDLQPHFTRRTMFDMVHKVIGFSVRVAGTIDNRDLLRSRGRTGEAIFKMLKAEEAKRAAEEKQRSEGASSNTNSGKVTLTAASAATSAVAAVPTAGPSTTSTAKNAPHRHEQQQQQQKLPPQSVQPPLRQQAIQPGDKNWMDDRNALSCLHCTKEFTLFRRRHHCRACGKIYCSDCCPQRIFSPLGKEPMRVCEACLAESKRR